MRRGRLGRIARLALVLLIALAMAPPVPPARAASFAVNSNADEPDATPGDGLCVSTPSGACTLRAAIMQANALGGSHTITLPAGTYQRTNTDQSGDGTDTVGALNDLDVTADITLVGTGARTTIIQLAVQG